MDRSLRVAPVGQFPAIHAYRNLPVPRWHYVALSEIGQCFTAFVERIIEYGTHLPNDPPSLLQGPRILEKHRRTDQKLKKRVLKLEFCLQETMAQTRKLQKVHLCSCFNLHSGQHFILHLLCICNLDDVRRSWWRPQWCCGRRLGVRIGAGSRFSSCSRCSGVVYSEVRALDLGLSDSDWDSDPERGNEV